MKIETSYAVELDTKSLTDEGEFSGVASPFGTADLGRDVVLPGAFRKSLIDRPAPRVKLLRNHDQRDPVGRLLEIVERSDGLHVKGRLIRDTRMGAETFALMKEGALDGLSIGYRTKQSVRDQKSGHRQLAEVDLFEISVVTFPMHPDARVSGVKSIHDPERARSVVAALSRATAALRT